MREMTQRTLPLHGALLRELTLHGNGKDCLLRLVTASPARRLQIEMRDPRLVVEVHGKVSVESFNNDDRDLGIRYRPLEDLRITTFELDTWGSDESWDAAMVLFDSGRADFIGETISVARIVLCGGPYPGSTL